MEIIRDFLTFPNKVFKALLTDNAYRADRPGEPHTERGFLHFSRQVCYSIELGQSHCEAQSTCIKVNDIPINEQLERHFLIACSSFVRQAAITWEKYAAQYDNLPLVNMHIWPRIDTNLFLRDEIITYIRENGGITEQSGARQDGRVQIIWPKSELKNNNDVSNP